MEWHNVRKLAAFDLRMMLRHRESILWMFIMPVLFMVLIGKMSGSSGSGGEPHIGVIDEDKGVLAASFLARVDSLGYEIDYVDTDSTLAGYRRQLRIPAGFTEGALRGEKQEVEWYREGEGSENGTLDKVRMQRALLLTLGDLVVVQAEGVIGEEGADDSIDSGGDAGQGDPDVSLGGGVKSSIVDSDSLLTAALLDVRNRPRQIRLDVSSAGPAPRIPDGFQQSVPGILVMFVLLVLLTTGGVFLVVEREEGLLRRLASAPVSRSEVLVSKLIARVTMGIVQVAFALVVGSVLRVDWGGRLPQILVLLAVYGTSMSSLSLLFGNLARTRGQVVGFGVLAANVFGALGGCWWPIEVVPETLQRVAWMLPTGWAMYGMHRLMNFGASWDGITLPLGLLAGFGLVCFLLARRTFRYQ